MNARKADEGTSELRALDPVADRPQIERLLSRAVPGDYLLGILDRWLAQPGILGAFDRGRLVGIERLDDLELGEGWVGAIRVDPDRRREGWGRRLTRYALDRARELGMSRVRLIIEDDNRASQALAASLGFRPVLALAHAIGIAPPEADRMALPLHPLRSGAEVAHEPAVYGGLAATRGFVLTTTPRPMRFARATPERWELEAKAGSLVVAGPRREEGLGLLSLPGAVSPRGGRPLRLLAPLGSDALGIFRAASKLARAEGSELEGFLPVEGTTLPALEAEGWSTGPPAFWGERVHLYEVEP